MMKMFYWINNGLESINCCLKLTKMMLCFLETDDAVLLDFTSSMGFLTLVFFGQAHGLNREDDMDRNRCRKQIRDD